MSDIYDKIIEAGYARAYIEYSGGNDDGGVTSICVSTADRPRDMVLIQGSVYEYNPDTGRYEYTPNPTADQRLYDALADHLYALVGSFAGEFEVEGTLVLDAERREDKHFGNITTWVPFTGDWYNNS